MAATRTAMKALALVAALAALSAAGHAGITVAAGATTRPAAAPVDAKHLATARKAIGDGVKFLLSQRNDDGGWGFRPGRSDPAMTSMALKVLLQDPGHGGESETVKKGFDCLMKFRQKDGGFYDPRRGNANYYTAVAVMALAASKAPAHKPVLARAVKFLRGLQTVPGGEDNEGDKIAEDHPFVGGVSYGKQGRPDVSNVGMWMEALHEAGVSGDDEAMQRAVAFVKRLQNTTEGTEGQAFVVRGADDGGFVYALQKKDGKFVASSAAGSGRKGLRSYGSMTYTGFKSMLYANARRDDPRVKAAFAWIRKHWRLDANPNMPEAKSKAGLYYYYHVFAKALRAWGRPVITDSRGIKHNWRHELIEVLDGQRRPDGSWVNPSDRWMEGVPALATCYSVLAMQEALK